MIVRFDVGRIKNTKTKWRLFLYRRHGNTKLAEWFFSRRREKGFLFYGRVGIRNGISRESSSNDPLLESSTQTNNAQSLGYTAAVVYFMVYSSSGILSMGMQQQWYTFHGYAAAVVYFPWVCSSSIVLKRKERD